ncbi:hypothetical protein FACS1894186_3820 [Alphaproteobacteria bacterium]|nr:hypothetical protein FACS1894186_3820 [Alphaproteobacteria bacterium]
MKAIKLSLLALAAAAILAPAPAQAKYTNPLVSPHYAHAKRMRSVAKGQPTETTTTNHLDAQGRPPRR